MKKRIIGFTCACMAVLMMGMTVFAASANFSTYLPIHQGDKEVSTIKKESTYDYFMVNFSSIGSGTTKVCVWTEKPGGENYSSPSKQVGTGMNVVKYSTTPEVGKNVVLNMDNPVYVSYTVPVSGVWTPN